jgi:Na+-exporting ATPase
MSQPRTENTPSSGEKSANISFLGGSSSSTNRSLPWLTRPRPFSSDVAPHTLPAEDFLSKLSVDPKWGLDEDQAQDLLAKHGPNRLKPPKKISSWRLFMAQVLNAMTLVLIAVCTMIYILNFS